MKKQWNFGLKVADSHSEPGNLQKLEDFFHCFFIFFFIFLSRGTWNPGKPWKTMKNNGKPSKTKEHEKKWSCKWKKNENLDSKLQILTPNQEIFKNSRKFSFFHGFFIFLSRGTWNPGKPWKTMKNNGKPIKNKGKWKKNEVANEKTWKFGLKVADSHSEPGNLQKLEEIFIFFSFFFIFLSRGTWNPGKPWKTMKNNGKPSKTKENEKKWSCKWKKHENLDSKLQILTPNQEIFKNSRKFSFFSFFFIVFSFSFPMAPEIQENHEKQWKTMENHQKQRNMKKNEVANEKKMKIWTQSCRFSLRTGKSSKTRGNFHFFSFFFIFLARGTWNPGKPWKTMKNHQKQRKWKKLKLQMKKNEVANEKMKLQMKKWSLMAKGDEQKWKKWR